MVYFPIHQIFRHLYFVEITLNKLISAEGNGMIKIITGIRRCGKSFLLFNIFLKLIIVGDRYHSGYNEEGILMMSLSDFLLGKGGYE